MANLVLTKKINKKKSSKWILLKIYFILKPKNEFFIFIMIDEFFYFFLAFLLYIFLYLRHIEKFVKGHLERDEKDLDKLIAP
jgi:hypothetical protein